MAPRTRITSIKAYKIDELKSATRKRNDFGFFRLEEFVKDIDHLKTPHRHDHFAIFFITLGKGIHTIDFRKCALQPNRLFLLSPGQIHAWKFIRKSEGYVLLFTKEFFSLTNQSRDLRDFLFYNSQKTKPYIDIDSGISRDIRHLFQKIEEEYVGGESFGNQVIRSYLNILLFKLIRIHNKYARFNHNGSVPADKIREYERTVNKNFRTLRTVADYAPLLHVTPNYLNAACRKVTGKAAGEIIRDRVLLEAKRLLANTDSSISEIAYQLNFEDNSYFGRFFKKNTKMTPANFREKSKGKIN